MKYKVLIIDDSNSVSKTLKNFIENDIDIDVFIAKSLKGCADLLLQEKGKFDIFLADLGLPDAPNGEIVDFLSKFSIPIVVLTGSDDIDIEEKFRNKHIVDYIIKDGISALAYASSIVKRILHNKNVKVLVVDDSKSFVEKTVDLLKRYRIFALSAFDGEEAYQVLKDNSDIKIVLTDYMMPKMNGLEFLEELRKDNFDMPFIFVTARDEPDKMLKAIQLDINNYVLKPINLQNLLSVIDKVVEKLYKEYLILEKNSHIQLNKDLFWNKNNRTLIFENEVIKLTKKELMFIEILMAEENMVHKIEDIICTLWNDEFLDKDYISNLKNIISRLRNKVPSLIIENLYGMGYKINIIKE